MSLTITRSFRSVTILEGESVTISCLPSIPVVTLTWLHNGTNILADDITFSTSKYDLIIKNAVLTYSGVYTCTATSDGLTAKQNISVTIVAGKNCFHKFSKTLICVKLYITVKVSIHCSKL